MAILSTYTDDTATTSSDKYLTVDSSGSTKLTPASTLKNYVLATGNITSSMLGLSKTTDANGWTVYDYGNWKVYKKRLTNASTYAAGQAYDLITLSPLPTGMSTLGTNFIDMTFHVDNSGYAFTAGLEMTSSSTSINIDARNNGGTTITFNSVFDLTITTA